MFGDRPRYENDARVSPGAPLASQAGHQGAKQPGYIKRGAGLSEAEGEGCSACQENTIE